MAIALYGHHFSSYTWKALIPLYEKQIAFEFRPLGPDHPDNGEALQRLWPVGKFPVLVDGDRTLFEASIIVEYCDRIAPEPRMIPDDPDAALMVRLYDRVFDNHVMSMMQAAVEDALSPAEQRSAPRVIAAMARLDTIYAWLDARLAKNAGAWAVGDAFTLADCAAAPSLFYADWVHQIPETHAALRGYRARLLARPSVARCVEDARPYRPLFPLGAPDRD